MFSYWGFFRAFSLHPLVVVLGGGVDLESVGALGEADYPKVE